MDFTEVYAHGSNRLSSSSIITFVMIIRNAHLLQKDCSIYKILLFTGLPSLDFSDFFIFFLQPTGKQLLSF